MSKEAMKLALESLERADKLFGSDDSDIKAINALKEAIASPNEKLMHPEIKKMYEDFFDKCFAESSKLNAVLEEAMKQGELMALKKGECWPEEVMRQWDYWRKEIANGHKGSAPRDWFEGLSELKLIDTTPQQRTWVGLKDEEKESLINKKVDGAYLTVMETIELTEKKLRDKNYG